MAKVVITIEDISKDGFNARFKFDPVPSKDIEELTNAQQAGILAMQAIKSAAKVSGSEVEMSQNGKGG